MKVIKFSKDGHLKFIKNIKTFYEKDFDELSKSFTPGEWVLLYDEKTKSYASAFINLGGEENHPIVHLIETLNQNIDFSQDEREWGLDQVLKSLKKSIDLRNTWVDYEQCCRLVYGVADLLPGLIVDRYKNAIMLQINTAGIDRYREDIRQFFKRSYPDTEVLFLDNPKYRQSENLPFYEDKISINKIDIEENGFHLKVSLSVMQKIGYYYDHRRNRQGFESVLRSVKTPFNTGLDLFCYMGSWGLHMLRAGVKQVTFVDQGKVGDDVSKNLIFNGMEDRGEFIHSDVYKFLDQQIEKKMSYDVICSDPPAFAKSSKMKNNALGGYLKLHERILRLLGPNSYAAICSCTHYVSFEELDETVQEAARKVGRKIYLVDMGLQAPDHPMTSLKDKTNYLKYLAYRVE